ncbi:MAG TPA: lactate utilization protein [Clostridiales bacterium]|nr:lactate utilization protein [Clostridiales bacterium]HPV01319.1 lactate utilization protein [Clostridiales bacterium]
MDSNLKTIIEKRIEKTIKNLEKNNMQAYYVESKADVADKVRELMSEGQTVAVGGSMTLFECGIIDLLRSGSYRFLDRYQDGLSREDIEKIYRESFFADTYISSTNAITENGELYNVDGNSNRVAAICYGPKSVIIVAGYNKIVKDIDEAIDRVKRTAAPANTVRLGCQTYCREKGECMSLAQGETGMAAGCGSPQRICCSYVVSGYQRVKGRIKVIIVGEELGY